MSFVPSEMDFLLGRYNQIIDQAKEMKYVSLEEQLLPLIIAENWRRFELRFTDYRVLSNLEHLRYDTGIILRNISHMPREISVALITRAVQSIEHGCFRPDVGQLASIIYHGHLFGYYNNRDLSDRLARIIHMLVNVFPDRQQLDLGKIILSQYCNVLTNIGFNQVTFPTSWKEFVLNYPEDLNIIRMFL